MAGFLYEWTMCCALCEHRKVTKGRGKWPEKAEEKMVVVVFLAWQLGQQSVEAAHHWPPRQAAPAPSLDMCRRRLNRPKIVRHPPRTRCPAPWSKSMPPTEASRPSPVDGT